MKKVSILISNYNSYEAIQLCIESIRHYTTYPNYNIVVYDDCSINETDLEYLRKRQDQGWLKLTEGKDKVGHGGSLNFLINEYCQTDLAMILDCDIQILAKGWLTDMVELISKDEKAIVAGDSYGYRRIGKLTCLAPFCDFWFAMINMIAYRDGMQIDWSRYMIKGNAGIKNVIGDNWKEVSVVDERSDWTDADIGRLVIDVGCKLVMRTRENNSKGYYFMPLPQYIKNKYYHFIQISNRFGAPDKELRDYLVNKFYRIKIELGKLKELTNMAKH